jgi:hypothetical protein
MPTYLQEVTLPERCFLHEVLLWVAVQRLPVATFIDGKELRDTDEVGGYVIEMSETTLFDETRRLGIPSHPDIGAWLGGNSYSAPALYEKLLAYDDLDEASRRDLETKRDGAIEHTKLFQAWDLLYQQAIEYPVSKIFVALRSGDLKAKGRLLPTLDKDEAFEMLSADDRSIYDIEQSEIPPSFWSLQGIDFDASAAKGQKAHYCHIAFRTIEVISLFPGDRESVNGVERVGDVYVIHHRPSMVRKNSVRGRPSYPWESFHIEVAAMVRRDELPAKKEAAIEHFQTWFQKELGIRPSRAAVGDKLKPYYDKFVKPGGQKTGQRFSV